jgi:NAD(P)-dependent dehydrogenase (short-subunit alcohol dehydrogenase family)
METNKHKKMHGKTVFITGGLSGIGHSCALASAKEGAHIVIADLKNDGVEVVLAEIRKHSSQAVFIPCDVSVNTQVQAAIHETLNLFGGIDVALNNAGIGGEPAKVGEMTEQNWLKVIGVNLNGVFNCMRYELVQMAKLNQGIIINMASILGRVGFANSAHYVAAKHGVIGLTQTAALEYAEKGIRINAICPGFIVTPLLDKAGITENSDSHTFIENLHPMKRLGTADEIAQAFMFLASEESSFITGTCLEVDGGYLAQ